MQNLKSETTSYPEQNATFSSTRVLTGDLGFPISNQGRRRILDQETEPTLIDWEKRLRRSSGRGARVFSASAKLTREEHNELEAAAKANGKALSEWAREALLKAARGPEVTPAFTEIIATRLLLNSVLGPMSRGEMLTQEVFSEKISEIRRDKRKIAAEVMQQYVPEKK